jgi:hypothetical protein
MALITSAFAGSADTVPLNCAPFTTAAVPIPTPQTDPHAIERFQVINRAVKSAPVSVLFLGDLRSLTAPMS